METKTDPAVFRYMNQVQKFPRLSRQQEADLCRRWRDDHDREARDELVKAHLRFVVIIALKYRRYGLPLSELIAEGNFGLLHAVDKFEPERGLRFLTYAAYWIRAHILNTVTRSWSLVSAGSGSLRSSIFFKLRREKARIVNLVGEGDAAHDILAERFNAPRAQIVEMVLRLETRDFSLDSHTFGDDIAAPVDTMVAPGCDQEQAYESCEGTRTAQELVGLALRALDSRERFVVENRQMSDTEDEMSLAEIGRRLGVSRERARQLETRAIRKLRQRISELSSSSCVRDPFLGSAA